jgi:hypothetical protein
MISLRLVVLDWNPDEKFASGNENFLLHVWKKTHYEFLDFSVELSVFLLRWGSPLVSDELNAGLAVILKS